MPVIWCKEGEVSILMGPSEGASIDHCKLILSYVQQVQLSLSLPVSNEDVKYDIHIQICKAIQETFLGGTTHPTSETESQHHNNKFINNIKIKRKYS
jgi:hypothetical protein